jgi:hypothetical protein
MGTFNSYIEENNPNYDFVTLKRSFRVKILIIMDKNFVNPNQELKSLFRRNRILI